MIAELGVLTFHRCINYGSYWQARCLVEGLRHRGFDAVLLDHRSRHKDRAEWRCALHPVPQGRPNRRPYARKARRLLEAVDRLPLSPPFALERPGDGPRTGRVVVGSDEVWNLLHPWYGGESLFYGRGIEVERIAYAASFGNQQAEIPLDPGWAELLRGFSAIAVRDHNSHRLVSEALDSPPPIVLDPCLQFADRIVAEPFSSAPYLALYGHSFPDWFIAEIRGWADRRGLPIVSFGYHNDWADRQWIDAAPQDFADAMAGAAAVATNFFHGCVFSLLNRKPFVCVPSDYRSIKVRDLLGLVGARERLLTPEADQAAIDDLLGTPAGTATYETLDQLRRVSSDYLDHALA